MTFDPNLWGAVISGVTGVAAAMANNRSKTKAMENQITKERGEQIASLVRRLDDIAPRMTRVEAETHECTVALKHNDSRHAVLIGRLEGLERVMAKVVSFFERREATKLEATPLPGGDTKIKKQGSKS